MQQEHEGPTEITELCTQKKCNSTREPTTQLPPQLQQLCCGRVSPTEQYRIVHDLLVLISLGIRVCMSLSVLTVSAVFNHYT